MADRKDPGKIWIQGIPKGRRVFTQAFTSAAFGQRVTIETGAETIQFEGSGVQKRMPDSSREFVATGQNVVVTIEKNAGGGWVQSNALLVESTAGDANKLAVVPSEDATDNDVNDCVLILYYTITD